MRLHRVFVEAWDPEYGFSFAPKELSSSAAEVDAGVEIPPRRWKPLAPPSTSRPYQKLVFVDGVRRVDARVWIEGEDGRIRPGLAASYAAGAVLGGSRAEIGEVLVRRALIAGPGPLDPLATEAGVYAAVACAGEAIPDLFAELQERLRALEAEVASKSLDGELVVVDGPLASRHARAGLLGYVKSHHVRYLDETLEKVVRRLGPGERTPLFRTATSWSRWSTYLRLDGGSSHPWAGVVRLEMSAEWRLEEVVTVANRAALTLPRYASVPHKDPRAPQNLFPIGGLERELRRRLGDAALVHRALRSAAARNA